MRVVKEIKLERMHWLYMKGRLHQVSYTWMLLKLINNLTCKQNRQKHMTSKFKHMKFVCSGQANNMFCKIMIKVRFFFKKSTKTYLNWLCHIIMHGETQRRVCHPFPQPSHLLLLMRPAPWKQCGPSKKGYAFSLMDKWWSEGISGAEVTFNYCPCLR